MEARPGAARPPCSGSLLNHRALPAAAPRSNGLPGGKRIALPGSGISANFVGKARKRGIPV
jgi:hypothetical protein